ncbi:MAG: EAL domain-containing protein [Pseudomonadales bacterium]|jgi:diguanylate cyclase (GGDEF)-like protein/PAS domain S-box-containing protein
MIQHDELILVVDDQPRMLQSLQELMTISGYRVITALGGQQAVHQLSEHNVDLMLLDLKMPGYSGHQVMDYIDEHKIDTTVIVVSGESSFDTMSQVLRRRAYDYIRKPYVPDELLHTVENALKARRLANDNRLINDKLVCSERLHRYLVNSSPDIVYLIDRDGRFTYVNDRITLLLGFQRDDLIGRHYRDLVFIEDIEQAAYVFSAREIHDTTPRNVELRFKCKDQDRPPKYFEINTIPIELESNELFEQPIGEEQFVGVYGVARDISERKEAERTINFQAYHDLLTRLPNRALFKDRLNLAIAQAKRSGQKMAVMFLDLDRFKLVNDTLGHIYGDELLQLVSQRLQDCLREGDTLARFGGDEFTLLLPQITGQEDATAIARKIIETMREPFVIEGNDIYVTISVGIAMYPHDGATMEALVKNADIAMYHIKGRGKNDYQFFSREMNEASMQRLSLERDMRKGLEQDQFELHFQPQVDVVTGQVVAVEALVRWHHPTLGMIAPTDFIAVAEDTGLILPLGEWVIRKACRVLRSWRDAGIMDVRMAINLSAMQIEHKSCVELIKEVMYQNRLSGHDLEMEITENLIMQDMENAIKKLIQLNELGVQIAIDDFGTGYSSLSYLQKLPIHTLKIDRSFVHEIQEGGGDACIVDAVIAMARGLKLNLIAEGVETEHQMEYLRSQGCGEMQGYYFGAPAPEEETVLLLTQSPFDQFALPSVG